MAPKYFLGFGGGASGTNQVEAVVIMDFYLTPKWAHWVQYVHQGERMQRREGGVPAGTQPSNGHSPGISDERCIKIDGPRFWLMRMEIGFEQTSPMLHCCKAWITLSPKGP